MFPSLLLLPPPRLMLNLVLFSHHLGFRIAHHCFWPFRSFLHLSNNQLHFSFEFVTSLTFYSPLRSTRSFYFWALFGEGRKGCRQRKEGRKVSFKAHHGSSLISGTPWIFKPKYHHSQLSMEWTQEFCCFRLRLNLFGCVCMEAFFSVQYCFRKRRYKEIWGYL